MFMIELFFMIFFYCFIFEPIGRALSKKLSLSKYLIAGVLIFIKVLIFKVFGLYDNGSFVTINFPLLFIGTIICAPIFNKKDVSNVDSKDVLVELNENTVYVNIPQDASQMVRPANFNPIFSLSEDDLIDRFIDKELKKTNFDKNLIHEKILKKKTIMTIINSILFFAYISSIFFHFPLSTYVIGFIVILIIFLCTKNYDIKNYIRKEVKSRPGEKISNIVMNIKNNLVIDDKKGFRLGLLILSLCLPLLIFYKPRILYEKVDGGYAVRYYIYGLTNFETVEIPSTYKNQPVISLRGNAFSNMKHLKSVKLPSTIKEIRGQAFKNDIRLKYVELPSELEYLGGGAFYNCKSLESVVLPESLTYLGGESFYGCSSLYSVNIPSSLTEIRGDTFEYCTSLTKIEIPDSITRIGGHAFYGDSSLQEVKIGRYSKLKEIGSSAFRQCNSLKTITLPNTTIVNERAFKESPTKVNYYEY